VRNWPLFLVSLGTALLCVYVLPFFFPPSRPTASQSYVVGYSNRVAFVSVVLISVLVTLFSLRRRGAGPREFIGEPKIPWPWLASALVLVAAWNGGLSYLVFTSHNYGVEDFYFLPQLEKFYYLHLHLYRDIEFPYGQLLFYPPVWIHWLLTPFHISLRASYYIALLFHHLLGVGMLYFVVNRLPMPRAMRMAAFACVTLFSFNPTLGPNCTLLRYMLPIFFFVLLSQIKRPVVAAAAVVIAQILIWMDSSEQAISFGFAVTLYCCYRAWRHRIPLWMLPIASAVAGTALYLAFVDPNVLFVLSHMSGGSYDRIPQPFLMVVTLLVAVVWLVPRLVGRYLSQEMPECDLLLGLYALGLVLLPVSFGNSNNIHIPCAGAVLFLLSLVAVGEWKLPMRGLWTATVTALYFLMIVQWNWEMHLRFIFDIACIDDLVAPVVARLPSGMASRLHVYELGGCSISAQQLDVAALHSIIGDAPFATPYRMPEIVEETLPQIPNYVPSYWHGTVGDPEMEQKKVVELRQVQWALLWGPPGPEPSSIQPDANLRFGKYTLHRAARPLLVQGWVTTEINENWKLAEHIGKYDLYRRIR